MKAAIQEQEIMDFLLRIEGGEIQLTPPHEPQKVYAGNVLYKASNGWEIVIFNDANVWDYIEYLKTDDGREIEYDEMAEMPRVERYRPTPEVAWEGYRIPGYLTFRCTQCGTLLEEHRDRSFLCPSCKER
jgi:hypothetical protein